METVLSASLTRRKHWPTAEHPEVRVVAGLRQRAAGKLDWTVDEPPADPEIADVVASVRGLEHADGWMIAGGEPTLRPDFPKLIAALRDAGAPRLGMITDGLALTSPKVLEMLKTLGLTRVRVRLAGARADAHDWLVGQKGAWRRAIKAVQTVTEAGLEAEVECTVTRPTYPYLEEAVEVFVRLGAKAVIFRRITARGPAAADDIALAPRLALLQNELEAAVQVGVRRGVRMMIEGFPQCAAPGTAAWQLATDAVAWALPESGSWPFLRPTLEAPASGAGCGRCPGSPVCCQAPSDYVRRFGRLEIDSESNRLFHPGDLPPTPLAGGDTRPPGRQGRNPPLRAAYVRAASRLPSLFGDPLAAVQKQPMTDSLRVLFVAPSRIEDPVLGDVAPPAPESTRDIRIRLVRAAQHGAHTLRIASAGSLNHPAAAEMLREATRLEIPRIEVAGEASALDSFGDMEMRRLRGISRIDAALFGPDAASHDAVVGRPGAFDETMSAFERLGDLVPSIRVGVYAVLGGASAPDDLLRYAEAWDQGDLPGEPFFRLSPAGGDLVALARAAATLPPGLVRNAIAAVLPIAIFPRTNVAPAEEASMAWGELPAQFAKPSGCDRYGCYTGRPSRSGGPQPGDDPGYAVGWTASDQSPPSSGA
jgi:MoaA/NifB/PqqE/SkfB family radical SAM enzyme